MARLGVWRRQTLDGNFHGGLLDVNVFIAGDAATPEYMSGVVADAFADYAGLVLGAVTYSALGAEYETLDSEPQVFDALAQTAGAPGRPAINVIVVSVLTGELESAHGLAAGIPGVALEHGTHASGVIMTTTNQSWLDRIVLRHEVGHLAGLFHTTEIESNIGDRLGDTPLCEDVVNQLDACPDALNVMFPFPGFGDEFSAMQARVIEGSALYRGIVEEGGGAAESMSGPSALGEADDAHLTVAGGAKDARAGGADAASAPWLNALPPGAGRLLQSAWCAAQPGHVDPYAALRRAGAVDARALLAVGADPRAPGYVRRRALAAAGRSAPASDVLDALEAMTGADQARSVRVGAVEGLRAASPARARALRRELASDADPVVGAVARAR